MSKMKDIRTHHYQEKLGLSCVENHVLAILNYLGYKIEIVFLDSFINVNKVINEMVTNKISYTHYYGINRVFYTTEELNILRVIHEKNFPMDHFIHNSDELFKNYLAVLIQVIPEKIVQERALLPWRSDHYVLIKNIENNRITILNDYPIEEFEISVHKSREIFKNSMAFVKHIEEFDEERYISSAYNVLKKISKENDNNKPAINSEIFNNIDDYSIFFRDALGVLKVSRKRLYFWFRYLIEILKEDIFFNIVNIMSRLSNELEKFYTVFETFRIRKRYKIDLVKDYVGKILHMDNMWIKLLHERELERLNV